ncbi:MAG: glycosyltransferase [Rhizobiaceae bacterium]|nr:glycosyltransferase [Rhizobiaceae bacterium]
MKIIHLHLGKEGGAERFFVNLALSLAERGIEQKFVIRPNRSWRGEIAGLGETIQSNYHYLSFSRYFLWFMLSQKVQRMAEEFQPDAIIAWMPRASRLMPAYPQAIKITRLGDFPQSLKHFGNSDVMIGNVPGIGERCRNLGWEKRVEIVSNFPKEVTPKPISRAALNTPQDAFVISSAGRFVHRKGMDLLIRATAKLDNAWLWLVGDGKEKDNLTAIAKEVGMVERLRFSGWQKEPEHILAASDVFCMPSRHEPLGNVILEAWNLGLPVVSARTPTEGPSWFMRDESDTQNQDNQLDVKINGLLVDYATIDADKNLNRIDENIIIDNLATALQRLRDEKKLRKTLIAGGYDTLEKCFSKKAITDQYLNLFSGKVGNHPL